MGPRVQLPDFLGSAPPLARTLKPAGEDPRVDAQGIAQIEEDAEGGLRDTPFQVAHVVARDTSPKGELLLTKPRGGTGLAELGTEHTATLVVVAPGVCQPRLSNTRKT